MIGTLARKRMQVGAALALVAMVTALFASFASAQTTDKVGDVNSTSGVCLQVSATTGADIEYALHFDGPDADKTVGDDQGFEADGDDIRVRVYAEDSAFDVEGTEDVENAGDQPGFVNLKTDLCEGVEDTSESTDDGGDDNTDPDAPANVGATFKITPDGTESPIIEAQSPTLLITLGDTDGVVGAGGANLGYTVSTRYLIHNSTATIQWVRVSGEIDHPQTMASTAVIGADADSGGAGSIVIPDGTTEGDYTVSVLAYLPDGPDVEVDDPDTNVNEATDGVAGNHPSERMSDSSKFTVGDAGVNAAAVELTLATSVSDNPKTTANEQVDETGTTGAGSSIWLKVAATNALGNKSNDGATIINSLTLIAPGGIIEIYTPGPGDSIVRTGPVTSATPDSASAPTPQDVMYARVSKKGSPPKPGSVDVYALLIGADGAPRSEVVTLSFTGAASSLELGDVPNVGPQGKVEFTIDATDAGGNVAKGYRPTYKVTDADGKAVGQGKVRVDTQTKGAHTDTPLDNNPLQATGLVTIGETTASGSYTIAVSLVGVADSEVTTEVTVVGKSSDVAVEASSAESMTIGDIITVTATLTDEDGNAAADGTGVNFAVSASTGLATIGSNHTNTADADKPSNGPKTKAGVATVKYAVVGSGTSVISAVASDSGATGVAVVISTAGTAAAADEAVSLDCLSATNGFATYTCGVDSSASELFGLVSGRGATAVHLWNGSDWVRYSVVDGAMVPGSSDFTVTEDDILYISN